MRRIALGLLIAGVAGFILAAAVAQLRNTGPHRNRTSSTPLSRSRAASPRASRVSKSTTGQPKEPKGNPPDTDAICARNLFKPACASASSRNEATSGSRSFSSRSARGLRLAGITFDGKELNALIENEVTAESCYVRRGDSVCGMTVQIVAQDHVVLSDRKKTLRLELIDPPPESAAARPASLAQRPMLPRVILPLPPVGPERKTP